jgi:dCMP deaminase
LSGAFSRAILAKRQHTSAGGFTIGEYMRLTKRTDYISWDEYFMGVAILSSHRSKDPSTQVGACIVDREKKIVGVGYNGFPIGCNDDELPWDREGDFLDTKYPYVCHAELNAILNSISRDLRGSSIYVALFPCNECAKAIIQSGIREVVYLSDKYAHSDIVKASKRMMDQAGLSYRQLVLKDRQITIDFTVEK